METAEACSLDEDGFRERLAAWRELLRGAGTRRDRDGALWRLPSDRAGALERLVDAERSCCALLDLRVREEGPYAILSAGLRPGPRPVPGSRAHEAARLLEALT